MPETTPPAPDAPSPPAARVRTVLFDLDGTLADTAPDLAFALNQLLHERGAEPLPYELIRPVVSHGAGALIQLGFRMLAGDPLYELLRLRLIDIYRENLVRETRLFPGMPALLEAIEARGMNWGVVTNKPRRLTEPLMMGLKLHQRAACIVSGDSTLERKPHPAPMLHACQIAGSTPDQCVYVGDAERDIEAGRRAGMRTVVALFGYIDGSDTPDQWGATTLIGEPAELLDWLDGQDS